TPTAHRKRDLGQKRRAKTNGGAWGIGPIFPHRAIDEGAKRTEESCLTAPPRFVHADHCCALPAIPLPHEFDMVFVTWGAICWLPDISRWAQIVAALLHPGGSLYLAEAHPAAYVFDDATRSPDGMPGWFAPYFSLSPLIATHRSNY